MDLRRSHLRQAGSSEDSSSEDRRNDDDRSLVGSDGGESVHSCVDCDRTSAGVYAGCVDGEGDTVSLDGAGGEGTVDGTGVDRPFVESDGGESIESWADSDGESSCDDGRYRAAYGDTGSRSDCGSEGPFDGTGPGEDPQGGPPFRGVENSSADDTGWKHLQRDCQILGSQAYRREEHQKTPVRTE